MQGSQGSPPDATEMSGLSYDSLSKHKTDCNKTGRKKTFEALVQLGHRYLPAEPSSNGKEME